jgi:hypothetical protein
VFTFGLIFGCALLGSFIQLIFIALALIWPIHSSIQLLGAEKSSTGGNEQQNEQIRQKLTALLAYWTIFAIQSLVLDHLLGAILRALLLYWPAKLAFVAFLLMGKWEGNNDRLLQTMLTPIGNFMAANMPLKFGFEPKWNADR